MKSPDLLNDSSLSISSLINKSCSKYFANDTTNFSSVLLNTNPQLDINQDDSKLIFTNNDQFVMEQNLKENYFVSNESDFLNSSDFVLDSTYNSHLVQSCLKPIEHTTANTHLSEYHTMNYLDNNNFKSNNYIHDPFNQQHLNGNDHIFDVPHSSAVDLTEVDNIMVDLSCSQQNFFELITSKDSTSSFNNVNFYENAIVS